MRFVILKAITCKQSGGASHFHGKSLQHEFICRMWKVRAQLKQVLI